MTAWWWAMGMAAVLNPCGVALLPATLAWLGGATQVSDRPGVRVVRAVGVGLGMALGFAGVLALLAILFHAIGGWLSYALRPLMLSLAGFLLVSGGMLAAGRWHLPSGLGLSLPRRARDGSALPWAGWVATGGVYGLGSLSCTLPLFVAALSPLMVSNWWTTARAIGAMAAGAAALLIPLSLGTLWLRDALTRTLGEVVRWLPLTLGAIVSGAGIYLLYYWGWGPGGGLG